MRQSKSLVTSASVILLTVVACSDQNNRNSPAFEMPSSITRGPIKLSYMTDEFEKRFDRKKDKVCTFSAGAGVLLILNDQQGLANINDKRIELDVTGGTPDIAVASDSRYTLTVSEGSPLHKRVAKNAADLVVKGPEGEAVISPGLWTCFPLEEGGGPTP